MSAANNYKTKLGQDIEELFGGEFTFYKSKLELKRKRNGGFDVVILSGSNRSSPYVDVSFYFGRNFDAAREAEKLLGSHPMPYQIQQYSPNVRSMKGLEYIGEGIWDINIEDPAENMAMTIKNAIEAIAFPFFDRFSSLEDAQKALANDDSWCISPKGPFYRMLFKIDAALNEIDHFKEWAKCLDEFYLKQANEDIAALDGKTIEI